LLALDRATAEPTTEHAMTDPTRELRAGPVRLKFQSGELRYLRVGDKEVVRRIYFAVRDGSWTTAMPHFTRIEVNDRGEGFTIRLAADCRIPTADFSWTGEIVGAADGKITFRAEGAPNADFKSNRIGLCVLYGSTSLAGQSFQTFDEPAASGKAARGEFPELI